MVVFELIANYFLWHYSIAIKNAILIWWDFEWFLWNYFSIGKLVSTFFIPWKRLGESTNNYFNLVAVGTALLVTTLMRLFGMVVRFVTIVLGLLSIILLIPLLILFLVIWILMPVILVTVFGVGINLIITSFS
ncbi:MAG: hypothetical protein HY225_03045 [Candidatus Vogelbacteria bacterium]|nr:hypothetical protein [Candidatus Vogelbacteria bacterium]